MSLHHAAQHLKAQGRGPDDQLIHMTSNEIAGLQALAKAHGTSLTVNPATGLPEAGALDKLMPLIVGAGLAYATGGMSLGTTLGLGAGVSNAAIIGGGMGLLDYARTGDLGQGIMTGLGGYGGAGLGAGLAATGAGPIPANMGAQVAPALTGPSAVTAGMAPGSQAAMLDAQTAGMTGGLSQGEMLAAQNAGMGPASQAEMLASQTAGMTPSATDFISQNKALLAMGATPALAELMTRTKEEAPAQDKGMIRPYQMSYNPQVPKNMVGAKYVPGQSVDSSERLWFQPEWKALPPYKAADGGLMALAAGGNVSTLGSYSDGGRLLKGPGDGMSDNIPAQIGAKQPARLADGEFVVPADVVSHLGNGSTDAGAKQLYKMMDRIRAQRTGKKKQAPEVNPKKAMPA